MRLCNKCILPETFPDIVFDDGGICNYCLDYEPPTYKGESVLEETLSSCRVGKRIKYDCIVPISGGRDSAYVLHQIVRRFGLKSLAFNYDNGFVTETAKKNIRNIVAKLGVDLIQKRSKRNLQRRLFRENYILNSRKSLLHVLRDACNGCSNGYKGGAISLARRIGVKTVIFGDSKIEESWYKKKIFRNIKDSVTNKIVNALANPLNFVRKKYFNHMIEIEFPGYEEQTTDIKVVHFFDYIEWDERKIIQSIQNDLGWESDGNATWRVDCKIHVLVDYLTYVLKGFNEKDEFYSKLIRQGKISRGEALQILDSMREDDRFYLVKIEQLFGELGLDYSKFVKILEQSRCVAS